MGVGRSRDVSSVDLVGNDGRLVHNDVHVLQLNGSGLEVQEHRGVPVIQVLNTHIESV